MSVAVFRSSRYRSVDSTFAMTLSDPLNCTLATATLQIAIRGVIPPPAPAPAPTAAPALSQLKFTWPVPAWPNAPQSPWASPIQFQARCPWNNEAQSLSGSYESLLVNNSDPAASSSAVTTWSVTLSNLGPGITAHCQARMYSAGGWGDWGVLGNMATTYSACGNGWRELGEQCDDSNNVGGDGCSATG